MIPILLLFCVCACATVQAAARQFHPPEGFVSAKDLPEDYRARVLSVSLDRKDAFEGSVSHGSLDRKLFNLGNDLHIISRESTIRRRLLFAEGDEITKDRLAEAERALRTEEFLSDAILSVKTDAAGAEVLVTTFDQWTLVPGAGISVQNLKASDVFSGDWDQVYENEWIWWVGVTETNLLGTGTKVGGAIRHDLVRDTREIFFRNNNLTPQKIQVGAYVAWLSDGDSLLFKINKPLLARSDKYSYSVTLGTKEISERIYFDANQLSSLPPDTAEGQAGEDHLIRLFDRVATREIYANAARSYGTSLKFNVGPSFQYFEHHNLGGLGEVDSVLLPYVPIPPSAAAPEELDDVLIGLELSLYRYGYSTVRNFRNLKWNESVEHGWRLNSRVALNQPWLGAENSDFRLYQEATYTEFPSEALYVNGGITWQTFLSPGGDFRDGRTDAWWETALRETGLTSSWLSFTWNHLFATPLSRQLQLGELQGLVGYPSYYYSGQARFLATAEQRLFPESEILTMVPAYTAFIAAGNTFPTAEDFDAADLHWSVGLGLRLGKSKSTQKMVQHINVNFPLGDKYLKGPVVSILARKSL